MTLMNLLLIETFKSAKLNFQKLHFNWHIFLNKFQNGSQANRNSHMLTVFFMPLYGKKMEANSKFLRCERGSAIDRYLKQPLNNKPWSIIGDSEFSKVNQMLFAKTRWKKAK